MRGDHQPEQHSRLETGRAEPARSSQALLLASVPSATYDSGQENAALWWSRIVAQDEEAAEAKSSEVEDHPKPSGHRAEEGGVAGSAHV